MEDGARDRHAPRHLVVWIALALGVARGPGAEAAPNYKLSGPLPPGGDVSIQHQLPFAFLAGISFHVTADSTRVVYSADQDTDGVRELYSRALDGSGSPVKLNGALTADGSVIAPVSQLPKLVEVDSFPISADLSHIVYLADQDSDEVVEFYSRPLDGSGSSAKLNGPLTAGGDVRTAFLGHPSGLPRISADSSRAFYVADQDTEFIEELYSRPLDGSGSPAKLNATLPTPAHVLWAFEVAPDSSRVVYQADQDSDDVFELYSRPADGSGIPVKLNAPLIAGGDVGSGFPPAPFFQISSDSTRVVYVADQDTNDVREIYSRPLDGTGTAVKLNGALVAGGDVAEQQTPSLAFPPFPFQISPDSSRVVYHADQDTDGVVELYSRPLDGSGTAVKLSGVMLLPDRISAFEISPDSSRVVYSSNLDGPFELYSRPLDGSGSPAKLSGAMTPGGSVSEFRIAPDSARVVYSADQDTDGFVELYSRPLDGSGSAVKVSSHDVVQFRIAADSSLVLYSTDRDLYGAPIDGSSPPRRLNGTAVPNGGLFGAQGDQGSSSGAFAISPDSSHVVYVADQEEDERYELFATDLVALQDCGNGALDAGEECDDGNAEGGDCCSATCALETGLPCASDGDLCTRDLCDALAVCTHSEAPVASCPEAESGVLRIRNPANPNLRRVVWKWLGGPVVPGTLGTPADTTDYALCVYDPSGVVVRTEAAAGGTCGTRPCWKSTATGFTYKNASTSPTGALRMRLVRNAGPQARRIVIGKGANLTLPGDLQLTQPLTAQLINSDGTCWSTTFSAPPILSRPDLFKDKYP